MLFDHDAKVSGDSARFADLPRSRQPRGVRPLGGWRDCPGLLRPGHGTGNLRAEKMRRIRAAGYWPSPTAWAAVPPGHGDHADRGAALRRPQPALAHIGESRAGRLRSGRLREITDERTICDLAADALLLASVLLMARGWQARPSADTGLRDLRTSGRYLLRIGGLSPVVDDRPHFNVLTLRAAPTDAPSNWPPWPGLGSACPG